MKRILSFILAALILTSSAVSCSKTEPAETNASETKATETHKPETNSPATEPAETEAPAPSYAYDTSLITENGVAKSHIVLFDGASDKEKKAAEELQFHIKLVSGADVSVVNEIGEDSMPIIIATPDSMPELEELFPEDLAWLRAVGKVGDMERYGDDGFSIRQHDGKIYIFGANENGALNGTYDFIEENLDLIWVLKADSGIMYDEMPTINVVKTDYKEKSPFQLRYGGIGDARNKYATSGPVGGIHTVKNLLLSSPLYDPNITEYWETKRDGTPLSPSESYQVNYWSQLVIDAVAASVISRLDEYDDASRPEYYTVSMMDFSWKSGVYPEMNEPFEYAPGQFVYPEDVLVFQSTVFYTFINKIADQVAEKYPDVNINTLVYDYGMNIPVCDINDNVSLWFCPTNEDYTQESFQVALDEAAAGEDISPGNIDAAARLQAVQYEQWVEKHPNIQLYTYYFTTMASGWYERPIWYRMQNDFQYYAKTGNLGLRVECHQEGSNSIWGLTQPDGSIDGGSNPFTDDEGRRMNLLSYWLFMKLTWDPNEDVDALIVKFCDKVYGDASPYMQEYYDLLYQGWQIGADIIAYEFNANIGWIRDLQYYLDYFVTVDTDDGVNICSAIKEAINNAWEAADDRAKEFIRRPYEAVQTWE